MANDSTYPENLDSIERHRLMPAYFDGFESDDRSEIENAEGEKSCTQLEQRPRPNVSSSLSVEARDELARALLKRCMDQDELALKEFRQLMRAYIEALARRWLSGYYPGEVSPKGRSAGGSGNGTGLLDSHVRVVVNETLYEVWKQAGKFRGEPNVVGGRPPRVTTWMWPIIRSAALNFLKGDGRFAKDDSRQRIQFVRSDDVAEQLTALPDPGPTPIDVLLGKEQEVALVRFKRELSFDHQEVLNLVYGENMSCADAARFLQIPEGTVKTRLYHARKKLGMFLKADGGEE